MDCIGKLAMLGSVLVMTIKLSSISIITIVIYIYNKYISRAVAQYLNKDTMPGRQVHSLTFRHHDILRLSTSVVKY